MKVYVPSDIGIQLVDSVWPLPEGSTGVLSNMVPEGFDASKPQHYKFVDGVIVEKTEQEKASVDVLLNVPAKYRKQVDGYWVEMTVEEKAAVDAAEERERQDAKPLALKIVENKFLSMCDMLTGGTSHAKLGFSDIQMAIDQIADPATKMMISVQLLAIDAEAKREGGNLWWDDCTWHADIMG
jgi:hypothetical protein